MSEIKQKIITVDAKAFFKYFPKEIAEDQKCFTHEICESCII